MRKKFIAGNWKMFTTLASARALAQAVAAGVIDDAVTVAVCAPYPWLTAVAEVLRGSRVGLGGQNCHFAAEGAYTGEVSPAMLAEAGCSHVIIGHSERRHGLSEPDWFLNRKVRAALAAKLSVIFCVGETLVEREAHDTEAVLEYQLAAGLAGVPHPEDGHLVVAYEPVWAIGTGKVATPDQAQQAHAYIRGILSRRYGAEAAERFVIQYGGSVKPDNAATILHLPDVDGALVGGASLKAADFLAIVHAARA